MSSDAELVLLNLSVPDLGLSFRLWRAEGELQWELRYILSALKIGTAAWKWLAKNRARLQALATHFQLSECELVPSRLSRKRNTHSCAEGLREATVTTRW
eukprot:2797831-Alexandrium_andersonii.AAC.1